MLYVVKTVGLHKKLALRNVHIVTFGYFKDMN